MHTPCHDFVRFCRDLPTNSRYHVRTSQHTIHVYANQSGAFALFSFQSSMSACCRSPAPCRAVPSISAKTAKNNRQNSQTLQIFFVHFAIFAVFDQHFSLFCMVIHQFLIVLLKNFLFYRHFFVFFGYSARVLYNSNLVSID